MWSILDSGARIPICRGTTLRNWYPSRVIFGIQDVPSTTLPAISLRYAIILLCHRAHLPTLSLILLVIIRLVVLVAVRFIEFVILGTFLGTSLCARVTFCHRTHLGLHGGTYWLIVIVEGAMSGSLAAHLTLAWIIDYVLLHHSSFGKVSHRCSLFNRFCFLEISPIIASFLKLSDSLLQGLLLLY